jgi:hypothetical protein
VVLVIAGRLNNANACYGLHISRSIEEKNISGLNTADSCVTKIGLFNSMARTRWRKQTWLSLYLREEYFMKLWSNRHDILADAFIAANVGVKASMVFEWRECDIGRMRGMRFDKDMIVFVFTK